MESIMWRAILSWRVKIVFTCISGMLFPYCACWKVWWSSSSPRYLAICKRVAAVRTTTLPTGLMRDSRPASGRASWRRAASSRIFSLQITCVSKLLTQVCVFLSRMHPATPSGERIRCTPHGHRPVRGGLAPGRRQAGRRWHRPAGEKEEGRDPQTALGGVSAHPCGHARRRTVPGRERVPPALRGARRTAPRVPRPRLESPRRAARRLLAAVPSVISSKPNVTFCLILCCYIFFCRFV